MNRRIPILICIDVEPNERQLDTQLRVDWTGFEKSYEFFSELRPRLEMVTGLVFFECIQKNQTSIFLAHLLEAYPKWSPKRVRHSTD